MTRSRGKRTNKAIAMIASLMLVVGLMPLPAFATADSANEPEEPVSETVEKPSEPAPEEDGELAVQATPAEQADPEQSLMTAQADSEQNDDEEYTVKYHDPAKHERYCWINQEWGSNTVLLRCEWEENDPVLGKHRCEFFEWPVIVMNRPDDFYDGTPKKADWYVFNSYNYPYGKQYAGFPDDIAEWGGKFLYQGVDGTNYPLSYQAPREVGTYVVKTTIKIPHAVSPTDDGTFELEKRFEIKSTAYDVVFDSNVPATASTSVSGTMEKEHFASRVEEKALSSNQFVLPGYTFKEWNTQPDGSGTSYADKATVKGLSYGDDVTLYAQWVPQEYTITFVSEVISQTFQQVAKFDQSGTLTKIADMHWEYSNHVFHGWSGAGFSSFYEDGEDFVNLCTLTSDGLTGATLNADWVEKGKIVATVTKDGAPQAGFEACFSLKAKQGTAVFDLPENLVQYKDGKYVFDPVNLPDALTGSTPGQIPPGTYDLVFDGSKSTKRTDGSDFAASSIEITYGDVYAISTVFDYYTATLEADPAYKDVHQVEMTGKKPDADGRYTAVVRDNGTLQIKTTVNAGYHFDGYSATGVTPKWEGGDPMKAAQTITVQGQAAIMAHVEANMYAVSFDSNAKDGYTGEMNPQDMVYNEPQNLFANQFVRGGWTFTGWNTKADGSGTQYTDEQRVQNLTTENDAMVTLYAQWKKMPDTGTLTFDLAGGTLDGKTGSITIVADVGTQIEIPAAPTREGYTFKYWKGSEYYPGDKYRVRGDHAFTAVWEKNAEGGGGSTKGTPGKTGDTNGPLVFTLSACAIAAACALMFTSSRKRNRAYTGKHARR